MKRFSSACLALASALLAASVAHATRAVYGGVLRVDLEPTIRTLDPLAPAADPIEAIARQRALALVFETLVDTDAQGLRPALATAWEGDDRGARWRFRLRPGVRLHDGTLLEAWRVASALRSVEPSWRIEAEGDVVIIAPAEASADLPWTLADARHAIVIRAPGGALLGTGPFRIDRLEGTQLSLRANDAHWAGRPFADAVRIEMGRAAAVQLDDLESGRADIVAATPLDARRIAQGGQRVAASRALDLIALIFEPHRSGDAALAWRRTLAAAVNRQSLCDVLLQRLATPAVTLVPSWLSGYDPGAKANRSPPLTRAAVAALPADLRDVAIRTDPGDPLAQAIAERVGVDAREAGFSPRVQPPSGLAPRPDVRVVRVKVPVTSPDRALGALLDRLRPRGSLDPVAVIAAAAPLDAVYEAEQAALDRSIVVPLVHVPDIYGLSERVATWNGPVVRPTGAWNLADVWINGSRR